jgi:hypothetical protein
MRSVLLLAVLAVGLAAAKESSSKVDKKLVASAANITVDEVGFLKRPPRTSLFGFEIFVQESGARQERCRWARRRLSSRAVWWA